MDYRFSDKSTAYFRYNTDNSNADTPSDAIGGHGLVTDITHNMVLQYQTIISPTLINEAKFGLNRANYHSLDLRHGPHRAEHGELQQPERYVARRRSRNIVLVDRQPDQDYGAAHAEGGRRHPADPAE